MSWGARIGAAVGVITIATAIWTSVGWVLAKAEQIEDHEEEIEEVHAELLDLRKTQTLSQLNDQIGDLKERARYREERLLTLENPEARELFRTNIAEIRDEIKVLEEVKQCVIHDRQPCQ